MRLLSNNFLSMEAFYCQKNPCFSQQVTLNQLYHSKTECKKIRIHQRSAPSSSPRTMSTPMRVSVTLARKYAKILQCVQLLRGLGWEGCRLVSGRKRESPGVHWSSTRDDEAGESPAHLQPPGRARGHGRGRRRELPAGGAHPGLPHAQRIHSGQGNTGIIWLN